MPGVLTTLAIKDGIVESLAAPEGSEAAVCIDAAGGLVTESFVNGHLHLDKVYHLGNGWPGGLGVLQSAGHGWGDDRH